jgi:hypothetical protein
MLRAGNIAPLAKPFNLDELEELVRRGLNGGFTESVPLRLTAIPIGSVEARPARA